MRRVLKLTMKSFNAVLYCGLSRVGRPCFAAGGGGGPTGGWGMGVTTEDSNFDFSFAISEPCSLPMARRSSMLEAAVSSGDFSPDPLGRPEAMACQVPFTASSVVHG